MVGGLGAALGSSHVWSVRKPVRVVTFVCNCHGRSSIYLSSLVHCLFRRTKTSELPWQLQTNGQHSKNEQKALELPYNNSRQTDLTQWMNNIFKNFHDSYRGMDTPPKMNKKLENVRDNYRQKDSTPAVTNKSVYHPRWIALMASSEFRFRNISTHERTCMYNVLRVGSLAFFMVPFKCCS